MIDFEESIEELIAENVEQNLELESFNISLKDVDARLGQLEVSGNIRRILVNYILFSVLMSCLVCVKGLSEGH